MTLMAAHFPTTPTSSRDPSSADCGAALSDVDSQFLRDIDAADEEDFFGSMGRIHRERLHG